MSADDWIVTLALAIAVCNAAMAIANSIRIHRLNKREKP